jgi:predicted CXXCH cytochrome family protein
MFGERHGAASTYAMVLRAFAIGVSIAMLVGCHKEPPPPQASANVDADVHYVGSQTCGKCHAEQFAKWRASQHRLAMQVAGAGSVLGNFDGATFKYADTESKFTHDGAHYSVTTDGADGALQTFPVSFTFGVAPLQQYLIDAGSGRLQALSIAWDSRPKDAGGQRWYHLYANETIKAHDVLHWTQPSQNWNRMCADCHSTAVVKGYDASARSYHTTYAELSVGCEACHGPGGQHAVDDGKTPMAKANQVDVCAPCHARRSQLADGYRPGLPLLDYYMPTLLDTPQYFGDGQMRDEVYVYGSFVQSKMFQHGVQCSDCHEPHGATLRADGNAVCTRCHSPTPPPNFPTLKAKNYDVVDHHMHKDGAAGSHCVDCHMPARLYMGIDARHDHTFRVPRPDLAVRFGVMDACAGCHADRGSEWAAREVAQHFGAERPAHFGATLAAGEARLFDAEPELAKLAGDPNNPAMARARALVLLGQYRRGYSSDAVKAGLKDADPLVNLGALRSVYRVEPPLRLRYLLPLLDAPVRAVRIEAARAAAPALRGPISDADAARIRKGLDEYEAVQRYNADWPDAHSNLAIVRAEAGDITGAEQAYRDAIALEPHWVPAVANLADLYRATGRDAEAGAVIDAGLEQVQDSADLHYVHALWLTRAHRSADALGEYRQAASLAPNEASYAYAYGLALAGVNKHDEALAELERGHALAIDDADLLEALASLNHQFGDQARAARYAQRLVEMYPFEQRYQALAGSIAGGAPAGQ